jgi:hypothetical protein
MSSTQFVEALSEDSFVRDLHRRAVRLLNDPTLDRQQREFHIRRLQSLLVAHQNKEAAKRRKLMGKGSQREQVSRTHGNTKLADPSQVLARRREFDQEAPQKQVPAPELQVQPAVVANESPLTGRSRLVLKHKSA